MTTFQPPPPPLFPLPPVSIGDKIIIAYAKGNFNNCTYHVRGFVDGRIVLAKYSRRKKYYTYSVETGIWWSYVKTYAKIKKAKEVM